MLAWSIGALSFGFVSDFELQEVPLLRLRIGIQLASLRVPFRKALPLAAQLGADAVEIDARGELRPQDLSGTAVRQVRKLLEDHRLQVAAVGFYTRRGYGTEDELDRRVEATKQALAMAYQLGAATVVNYVGPVPQSREGRSWELLVTTLQDIALYGQRVGAALAARTGPDDGPTLAALLDALPAGTVGADLDPGGLTIHGFSPREAALALGRRILHVHARDATGASTRGGGAEVPVGGGSVDFAELLGILEEHDYRGFLTIERNTHRDPLPDVQRAIGYLRSLG